MKRIRLSIGSWAYCFGPYKDNPVPFDTVLDKLCSLGFDGVELGGFPPHPHPAQFDTKAKRAELKKKPAGQTSKPAAPKRPRSWRRIGLCSRRNSGNARSARNVSPA